MTESKRKVEPHAKERAFVVELTHTSKAAVIVAAQNATEAMERAQKEALWRYEVAEVRLTQRGTPTVDDWEKLPRLGF